jgi:hypothetical protein
MLNLQGAPFEDNLIMSSLISIKPFCRNLSNAGKASKKLSLAKEEMEAFNELMDTCRNNAMASGNACNPVIFEPMAMSILLAQQQKLRELKHKLNEVLWQKICAQENNPTALANPR